MKTLIALALLAPTAVKPVPAPPPPCITLEEVKHATLYILPPVIEGLTEQCRASLKPTAYLLTAGAERWKKLGAQRDAHWNGARGALLRLAGDDKAAAFSGEAIALLVRDMIKAEGGKVVKAPECEAIDRTFALLAPLPNENIAELVALAAETGMKADAAFRDAAAAKAGAGAKAKPSAVPFGLCPAPAPR